MTTFLESIRFGHAAEQLPVAWQDKLQRRQELLMLVFHKPEEPNMMQELCQLINVYNAHQYHQHEYQAVSSVATHFGDV